MGDCVIEPITLGRGVGTLVQFAGSRPLSSPSYPPYPMPPLNVVLEVQDPNATLEGNVYLVLTISNWGNSGFLGFLVALDGECISVFFFVSGVT